jgi:hypothetical protein
MEMQLRDFLVGHTLREGMMLFEGAAGPWAKEKTRVLLCSKLGYDPADDEVEAAQHAERVESRNISRGILQERRATLDKELHECLPTHKAEVLADRNAVDAELKPLATKHDPPAPVPRWIEACREFFGSRLQKHVHADTPWDVIIITQVMRALLPELVAAKMVTSDLFEAKALLGGIHRVADLRNQRAHLGSVTEPDVLDALGQMLDVLRLCGIDDAVVVELTTLLNTAKALVSESTHHRFVNRGLGSVNTACSALRWHTRRSYFCASMITQCSNLVVNKNVGRVRLRFISCVVRKVAKITLAATRFFFFIFTRNVMFTSVLMLPNTCVTLGTTRTKQQRW